LLYSARGVSSQLLANVRIHGTVSSVSGLAELIALAHREGWALVVIAVVSEAALSYCPALDVKPRTRHRNLTSYFMAGGVANVCPGLCAMRRRSTSDLPWDSNRPDDARSWSVSPGPAGDELPRMELVSGRSGNPPADGSLLSRLRVLLRENLQLCRMRRLRALESPRLFRDSAFSRAPLRDRDATGVPLALASTA